MADIKTFKKLALSFKDTEELPHFHLPSFRYKNKIFATLHEEKNIAMIKLSLIDQSAFCSFDKNVFYPVPGGWGKKGATYVELKKVKVNMLKDALTQAYNELAIKKPKKKK